MKPVKIKYIKRALPKEIDLFICSASFEERCFPIARVVSGPKVKSSIVFFNSNEHKSIIKNAGILKKILGRSCSIKALNTDKPMENASLINLALDEIFRRKKLGNILLESTTFTHETLLILLRMLSFKQDKFKRLFISYVGARDYSIQEADQSKKWLSHGISAIRSVVGYPGLMSPARKNHLIVMFGFESDRTQSLIEHLEFDAVSVGLGSQKGSVNPNHFNLNKQRYNEFVTVRSEINGFNFSLVDPDATKKNLKAQMRKFPEHNCVISPMNNKLSTIAAGLAGIENPRIQLIYAKPTEYNISSYSVPSDEVYIYEVPNFF